MHETSAPTPPSPRCCVTQGQGTAPPRGRPARSSVPTTVSGDRPARHRVGILFRGEMGEAHRKGACGVAAWASRPCRTMETAAGTGGSQAPQCQDWTLCLPLWGTQHFQVDGSNVPQCPSQNPPEPGLTPCPPGLGSSILAYISQEVAVLGSTPGIQSLLSSPEAALHLMKLIFFYF